MEKSWLCHAGLARFSHGTGKKVGFNYTSIREISLGRLIYIHDAPKMNARVIDVERVK